MREVSGLVGDAHQSQGRQLQTCPALSQSLRLLTIQFCSDRKQSQLCTANHDVWDRPVDEELNRRRVGFQRLIINSSNLLAVCGMGVDESRTVKVRS